MYISSMWCLICIELTVYHVVSIHIYPLNFEFLGIHLPSDFCWKAISRKIAGVSLMVWCFVPRSWENIAKTHWREAGLTFCSAWFFHLANLPRWKITTTIFLRWTLEKLEYTVTNKWFGKKGLNFNRHSGQQKPTVHITSRWDVSVCNEPAGRALRRVRQKSWEGRWWDTLRKLGDFPPKKKGEGPFVKGKDHLPNQRSYSFRGKKYTSDTWKPKRCTHRLKKLFKLSFIKVENVHNLYSSDMGSGKRCARIRFMISWGWSLKVKGNMIVRQIGRWRHIPRRHQY